MKKYYHFGLFLFLPFFTSAMDPNEKQKYIIELHKAVSNNDKTTIKKLTKWGPSWKQVSVDSEHEGLTPFLRAIKEEKLDLIRWFSYQAVRFDFKGPNGQTPLSLLKQKKQENPETFKKPYKFAFEWEKANIRQNAIDNGCEV